MGLWTEQFLNQYLTDQMCSV